MGIEYDRYKQQYSELSEFILPWRGRFTPDDVNRGAKKGSKIINNHATLAARTQAAGMMSGITSPARPWFQLITPDPELNVQKEVRVWLSDVQTILLQIFGRSNIYNALHNTYAEIGTFGTSAMIVLEDWDSVMRAHSFTVGEYRLATSDKNIVDTLYREQHITVKQAVDQFGKKVSKTTQGLYDKGQYDSRITICHMIEPNSDGKSAQYEEIKQDFAFRSIYYEKGTDAEQYLKVSGFEEQALIAPRWESIGGDTYSSKCPGKECLDDIKELQFIEKQKKKAIEKMVDPPMVGPESLKNSPSNTLAGGVTFVDAANQDAGFRPAYQVQYRVAEALEDIRKVEDRISKTYYEDLFMMLANSDRRQITAREVEERHEEKLLGLGPVLERLNDELLDPLIDRAFGIAQRAEILPPPPEQLQDMDLRVEYISIMAQAQKAIGVAGIEDTINFASMVAQVDPEALRRVNLSKAIEVYAGMKGIDPKLLRDDKELEKEAAEAKQEAAMQSLMEQAPAMAGAAQDLGNTPVEGGGSALDAMLPGGPQAEMI